MGAIFAPPPSTGRSSRSPSTARVNTQIGKVAVMMCRALVQLSFLTTKSRFDLVPHHPTGLSPLSVSNGVLQLSAGSHLRVQPGPVGLSAPPRVLASPAALSAGRPPFGELDAAALVVRVTPGAADSQTAHLADRSGALLAAVCWPGLKVRDCLLAGTEG